MPEPRRPRSTPGPLGGRGASPGAAWAEAGCASLLVAVEVPAWWGGSSRAQQSPALGLRAQTPCKVRTLRHLFLFLLKSQGARAVGLCAIAPSCDCFKIKSPLTGKLWGKTWRLQLVAMAPRPDQQETEGGSLCVEGSRAGRGDQAGHPRGSQGGAQ